MLFGKDDFGKQLADVLKNEGVDTSGLVYSDIHTTLAFVHLAENGERSHANFAGSGGFLERT